jgi:hypothetical protein
MPSYHWRETAVIVLYSIGCPFSLMRMRSQGLLPTLVPPSLDTSHTSPQDQTPAVYFPGKLRHGGHFSTVGTPHVVQDTLLEV